MKRTIFALFVPLLMMACGSESNMQADKLMEYDEGIAQREMSELSENISYEESAMPQAADHAVVAASGADELTPVAQVQKKKIIKEGRMGIHVDDVHKFKAVVDAAVAKYGGYYGGEYYDNNHSGATYTLMVRVPADNYEKFVSDVGAGDGKVLYKQINALDVTEAFVDLESRLATKRHSLARYRELMRRAGTINDIMSVEYEIRKIEEEIESAEGRLRLMSDRVSYSSLELKITQDREYTVDSRYGFWGRIKDSLSEGWEGMIDFTVGIVSIWPTWLILGVIFYFGRRLYLNSKRKRKETK